MIPWHSRLMRFVVSVVVLALFCLVLGSIGCKSTLSPLGYGYRAVSMLSKARDLTGNTIRTVCQAKFKECKAAHGTGNVGFRDCLDRCSRAVALWAQIIFPVVEASIQATLGALEAARAKEKKDWTWVKSALPAACGIAMALKKLKDTLGDKAKQILGYIEIGRKYVCP